MRYPTPLIIIREREGGWSALRKLITRIPISQHRRQRLNEMHAVTVAIKSDETIRNVYKFLLIRMRRTLIPTYTLINTSDLSELGWLAIILRKRLFLFEL